MLRNFCHDERFLVSEVGPEQLDVGWKGGDSIGREVEQAESVGQHPDLEDFHYMMLLASGLVWPLLQFALWCFYLSDLN